MPASPEVLYASLLQPFPTRALAYALRPVQAEAYALDHRLTELLIRPPGTPEEWTYELDALQTRLQALANHCYWADGRLLELIASADRDFQTAVSAARAMLAGLSVSGEGASLGSFEPNCDLGDDPDDPGLREPANDPEVPS
jgi:hypothetical protein